MAEKTTHQRSSARERRDQHRRPRPASKPGRPSSAVPRRGAAVAKQDEGGVAMRPAAKPAAGMLGLVLKRLAKHELKKGKNAIAKRVPGLAPLSAASDLHLPLERLRPQLPIQRSVDVAVPLEFAWRKWMELEFLPEGTDRVTEIEREGDRLNGRISGPAGRSWQADVLDERPCESFAWRSTDGSDCAGLVTFHRLSERLTRLELNLDVVPVDAVGAASLLTHLAHWRTDAALRRFKADLEFVSPDVYEAPQDRQVNQSQNGR